MLPKIETALYCTEMGRNTPFIFRYAYAIAKQFGAKIVEEKQAPNMMNE